MYGYDKILLESFAIPFEDDPQFYGTIVWYFGNSAQKKVVVGDTTYFSYYANKTKGRDSLQLVVEVKMNSETKKNDIQDFFVHHTSKLPPWKVKIVDKINFDDYKNTYIIENEEGGQVFIRLVNRLAINEPQGGDIINVQPILMADNAELYDNYEALAKATKSGVKPRKNALFPLEFLLNNSANLTEEERAKKPHYFDPALLVCAEIIDVDCYKWSLDGSDKMKMPDYISARVKTQFGETDIYFSESSIVSHCEDKKTIRKGNLIVARALLSADVCVGKNDKYQDC